MASVLITGTSGGIGRATAEGCTNGSQSLCDYAQPRTPPRVGGNGIVTRGNSFPSFGRKEETSFLVW